MWDENSFQLHALRKVLVICAKQGAAVGRTQVPASLIVRLELPRLPAGDSIKHDVGILKKALTVS